jgi:hypothetical protein
MRWSRTLGLGEAEEASIKQIDLCSRRERDTAHQRRLPARYRRPFVKKPSPGGPVSTRDAVE